MSNTGSGIRSSFEDPDYQDKNEPYFRIHYGEQTIDVMPPDYNPMTLFRISNVYTILDEHLMLEN